MFSSTRVRTLLRGSAVVSVATGTLLAAGGVAGATGFGSAASSTGFAGYALTVSSLKSGSVSLKIPSETCTGTASGVIAGLFDSDEVTISGYAQCNKGSKTLVAGVFVYVFGHAKTVAAKPGDQLTASFSESGGKVTAKVVDSTTKTTTSLTESGTLASAVRYGLNFLAEPGIAKVAPGAFGSVTFSSSTVNGSSLSGHSPVATTWVKGSTVVVKCGALSKAGSFTTTRA